MHVVQLRNARAYVALCAVRHVFIVGRRSPTDVCTLQFAFTFIEYFRLILNKCGYIIINENIYIYMPVAFVKLIAITDCVAEQSSVA